MATYNTNLNKNYCSDWFFWESVREILQNGIDQQNKNESNELKINYDEDKKTLTITNKESTLQRSTISMGCTTKRDDENSIGTHGEGYKVALLVLKRLGKNIVINNYKKNEKWEAVFEKDKNYDNEEVLKIKITKYIFKRLPDHDLSWKISNVSLDDWNSIQDKCLVFQEKIHAYNFENSSILLDEKFKGHIFINGLFVEKTKQPFEFGYNLSPKQIHLDRDRRSVDSFDLRIVASSLISKAGNNCSKELLDRIINSIKENKPDIEFLTSFLKKDANLSDNLLNTFIEEYGKNSYPVSSQSESERLKIVNPNLKPVIVNKVYSDSLKEHKMFSFDNISKKSSDNNITPEQALLIELNNLSNRYSFVNMELFDEIIKMSKDFEYKQGTSYQKFKNLNDLDDLDEKLPF